MRKISRSIISVLILCSASAFGQNAVRSDDGNFQSVAKSKAVADSTTTFTFTDSKGAVHPVFVGSKGAFFIGKVSKSGKYYRYYLKTEGQQ